MLYDVDAGRLERVAHVLEGQAAEHGDRVPFRTTTDLDDALEGADFVFTAIRVGGLEGRTVDEGVPLGHGVLGQETTGPGGICFALRTIPAMVDLAERIARLAPGAWLVNFTNPAGMVTEALQQVLGDRAIGICDSPSALCRRVAAALGRVPEDLWFDYFGLNHLGWLRAVRDGSGDLLPGLLADGDALAALEEGALFGAEWLRSLGMVPNEYLYYFYFAADTVDAISRSERPRGAYLLEQQAAFYDAEPESPPEALRRWRAAKDERDRTYMAEARNGHEPAPQDPDEPGGYEGEAMAVVEAIRGNTGTTLIVNAANRSALPFLDERAVVEVPCVVGAAGAQPVAVGDVPGPRAGADRDDQSGRTGYDRGGAHGLDRARDQGARAAPAGAVRDRGARDLHRVPRAPARPGGAVRLNVDLAVLTPAYLDYTFVGLEALPGPGEERFAGDMLRSPGGGAITAVGARRLGLTTALVAPLGDDLAGRFVRMALEEEGVEVGEPRGTRTPTTVVMPVAGERSMVTVDPGVRARASDLEPLSPRAVAATLEQIDVVPTGVCAYLTCGDDDARAFAGRLPRSANRPRALIVNRREAGILTGESTPEEAAEKLGTVADTAVVTLGPDGLRRRRRRAGRSRSPASTLRRCSTPPGRATCSPPRSLWGDLLGVDAEVALGWANLYAGLSVSPTPAPAERSRASGSSRRARGAGCRRSRGRDDRRCADLTPLLLLLALLAGCGTPGGDSSDNAEKAEKAEKSSRKIDVSKAGNVTLTVWDQEVRGGPAAPDRAAQRRLPGALSERDDQARREVVHRPQHDAQARRLRRQGAGRRAGQPGPSRDGRACQGRPAAAARRLRDAYGWADRYPQVLLDLNRFSTDGATFGAGKLFGISQMGEIVGVFYNRDKVPGPPATFGDFERSLAGAKADGEVPISFGNLDKWPGIHEFQTVQNAFAPSAQVRDFVFAREGASFDTPENREAAGKLAEWAKAGYFTKNFNGVGYDPAWQQFSKGAGPFLIGGTWLLRDLSDAMGDRLGFMLMPPQAEGDPPQVAGRREPAVRDHGEVRQPRRRGRVHRLPHRMPTPRACWWRPATCRRCRRRAKPQGAAGEDVFAAWRTLHEGDGLVPYLDYATPSFYDDITAARAAAAGRAPAAGGVHAGPAGRLREVHRFAPDMRRPPGEPRRVAYLYLLPGLALFAAFVLAPLGHAAWLSLFEWDGVTPGRWVGFDNYEALAQEPALRRAFAHSAVLLIFYAALPVAIGLLLAAAASRARVRGLTALRTILFLPQVIALVVVAVTWRIVYQPTGWLGNFDLALPGGRPRGDVGRVRALLRPVHGRRAEDPAVALRRRAGGRRRARAGVLRGHAAGAARGDRGRAHAHHDRGAAQLRPRLSHDRGRAGRRHHGARARGLPARVPQRRGGQRGGDRRVPRGRDLRAVVRHQPRGRPGGAHVIDRREQFLSQLVLGVFALIALAPIARIVLTALGDGGSFSTAWDDGHFGTYLRSSVDRRPRRWSRSRRCSRSWPATRSG